jgi:hypothetical protein
MRAALQADSPIEPQPLFEYSSKRPTLSSIIDLVEIDFHKTYDDRIERKPMDIVFKTVGHCNGIAFWIDYELHDNYWLTTGIDDENQSWVTYSKQGVHLLPKPRDVHVDMKLSLNVGFDFQQGQFLFDILPDSQI